MNLCRLAPKESLYYSPKDGIHLSNCGKEMYARQLINHYNYVRVCEEWKKVPSRPFSKSHRQVVA